MGVSSLDDRASTIQGEVTRPSTATDHSRSTLNSELVVADGSCHHIRQLLVGCQASVLWLEGDQDPFLAISQALTRKALQGAPIQTMHWVSHGSPGQLHIGDRSITTAALIAHAQHLNKWGIKDLAIWSCSVGSDHSFISVLKELTGAIVWASKQPIGRLADGSNHWQLASTCQKEAPVLPINASRQLAWNHQLAAPTLDSSVSPLLAAIDANTGAPSGAVGTLVSALIDSGGSLNNFSDADSDAPAIAITGTNLNGGTLYYSTNNGTSWSDVSSVSEASARVLYADSNTRLAFSPAADYTGTISDLITFKAWDRSGPISASLISNYDSSGFASNGMYDNPAAANYVALSADGNTAFVADGTSGLDIVRINNLASPFLRSTYGKDGNQAWFGNITLSADGNTGFISNGFLGVQIVDLADRFSSPEVPSTSGGTLLSEIGSAKVIFRDVTLSSDGNTAFLAVGDFGAGPEFGGLWIADVSNTSNPKIISTYRNLDGSAKSVTLSADGNTAFVAGGKLGEGDSWLKIFNVSKPAESPTLIASYATPGDAMSITLSADGNTAFVADYKSGLQIINVSNLAQPTSIASFDTPGDAMSITLSADGNTAFVADYKSGLQIINVSNLAQPTSIASFDTPGDAMSITLSADGNTAFVADGPGGVQIVDISDPVANGSPTINTAKDLNFSNTTDTAQITVLTDLAAPLTNFADSSRKQIKQLSVDAIKRVLISEISDLSPKAVKGFTSNQISVLSENVFTGLSTIQLSRLTKDAVTGLQRGQLKTLNGEELSAFKPKTLKLFPVDAITGLKPNSLNSLSKRQVHAFADDQLAGLNKRQIQKADVFIDNLSRQQKNNLPIGFNSKSRFTIDLLNTIDDDLTLLSAVDPLA